MKTEGTVDRDSIKNSISIDPSLSTELNPNKIGETVVKAIELGRKSQIPILFMANPGLGKSTTVQNYADSIGYNTEMVIGASFLPEDLSGYQVYDGVGSLKHITPVWFNRIWEAHDKGKATFLFFDELSGTETNTQNSSLHVIKERKLTNGNPLPDDTVIIAAANYKGNLSPEAHISAPELNRFIIYNIGDYHYVSTADIIREFTQPKLPKLSLSFEDIKIDEDYHNKIYDKVQKFFNDLFNNFAKSKNASSGYLDLFNKKYDDLYEIDGEVYNIITGRTINNLCIATEQMISMGIKDDDPFINMTLLGIIGAGTCNFNPDQLENFHTTAINLYQSMYAGLINKEDSFEETVIEFDPSASIIDDVQKWENYYESSTGKIDVNIINLHNSLAEKMAAIKWSSLTDTDIPWLTGIREAVSRVSNAIAIAEYDASAKNKTRISKCLTKFTSWVTAIDKVIDTVRP